MRNFAGLALLLLYGGVVTEQNVKRNVRQPNIVMMVADDLGWADMPWHDSMAIAPTLSGLADTGILLEQHYVQPICSPTRSALMTGKYPSRLGLNHGTINAGEPYGLSVNETLLSNHLRDLGYSVHGSGKWHLGYCSWALTPTQRGFDSFYGYYNGHETYFTKETHKYFDFRLDTLSEDGETNSKVVWSANGTYSSYLYADRAQKVIQDHDQSNPLFLYIPMQSVHNPNEVPEKYKKMYDNIIENEKRKTLLAMITAMDEAAEGVVSALKDTGMWENTIFIFFSDNGGPLEGIGNGQVNYPLRGGKYSYWEGGIRSVSFIHSPLLPGMRVNTELIHVTDWLPTLTHVAACGPEDYDIHCHGPELGDIDGVNQWRAIVGASPSNRTEFLVNIDQKANNAALRMGPWKLYKGNPGKGEWVPPPKLNETKYNDQFTIELAKRNKFDNDHDYVFSEGDKPIRMELYNVIEDPSETNEVLAKYPDIVKMMLERLEYYDARAIEPRNVPRDPDSDPSLFGGAWTPWMEAC